MELTDDEREADYQALLASVDMIQTSNYLIWHTYPGDETMNIADHIRYKAMLLR
jgi:hypothetical protein